MKARKTLTLLLLAALTLAACKYDDSELWEQVNQNTEELAAQAARIAALEAWQAETNTNIQALQTLLSTTDYITAVTPVVKDGVEVGFTISFLNTPAITIYHGTKGDKGDKGDTPQIGAAQAEDGNWYWTLNGEFLTDTDGNPIRANGTQGEQGPAGDDAPLPQLATGAKLNEQQITTDSQNKDIEPDAIYLSVDGGQTWTRVSGEKGNTGSTGPAGPQGDSFFKGIDTMNADYVTFTLADGSIFQVPRYTGISLTFNVPGVSLPYGQTAKIQCIVTGIDNPTADDLYLITVPDGWKASISVSLILTVTAPADITSGAATGEILVMLDNKKGSTTIGRITVFCGTELTIGNLQPGQLATLIGSRIDLKSITVTSGEINDDDWEAIKRNKDMLTDLDLAGTTYTGDDAAKFAYTGHMGDNSTLQTIKLPQGITDIRDYAFNHCSSLTSIDFPVALNTIGNYAFFGCSPLKSIEIPSGVTGIGAGAFGDCSSLSTATFLGETPPVHIGHVFYQCTALSDIYVPAGSVDAYKKTWFEYADKIVAIP
ncbi:leucine-rich repeat protein [Bacteroides sp. ET336]|uniref:leucine-rich repeat protein n=1 Tax=Bacteroides sp. ET336 TaxID=2972459 RepID=UPI0021AC0F5C|nr:leucine-rich repeat protein [Bacteroides sp. ET336]MCR8893764.1 leucine-rich repeat protein [Bacteroides sp. ET336]MDN0058261.1 leucine-rich repeat protein [Bacteroides caecigallinarum]